MSSRQMSSVRRTTSSLRRVRRVDHDRLPFVPWGLIPLIALVLLLLYGITSFAKNRIEAAAERTARSALLEIGADWADVEANGQTITLTGTPPSEAAVRQAVEAVEEGRAPTNFGRARPVTRVESDFTAPATPAPSTSPQPDMPTPGVTLRAPEWTYGLSDGVMELRGEVPDEATRRQIRDAARRRIDPPRIRTIDDRLTVADVRADAEYTTVALRSVNALAQCDRGSVSFVSDRFSIDCDLPEDVVETVRTTVNTPLPVGSLGDVSLRGNEAVEACEQRLREILTVSNIEFAPGSSVISPASDPILDFVAGAARECPGTLRIEGHTDNTGAADVNERLSLERAEAVRRELVARGISGSRLVAEGFGPRIPVATNATAEGRARNRRIEIKVVR